jgi:hypothetical protein
VDHTSDTQSWSSGEVPGEAPTRDSSTFICAEREIEDQPTHAAFALVCVDPEITDEPTPQSRVVIWLQPDTDRNAGSIPVQPAQ